MTKYRVVAVEPLKPPYEAKMSFEEIQEFVGGSVQPYLLYDDKVAMMNEDGRFIGLPRNRHMILQDRNEGLTIVGNFVVAKQGRSDYKDMDDKEVEEAKFIYRSTTGDETIFI